MIKKITKCLLSLTLLLTGVVLTPTRIHAEDAQPYAGATQIWNETDSIIANLGSAGVITLKPTYRFTKFQGDTEMRYVGPTTCQGSSGVTCTIQNVTVRSDATYCSLNTNNYLIVDYVIKTVKSGTTRTTTYRIMYLNNQINRKFVY